MTKTMRLWLLPDLVTSKPDVLHIQGHTHTTERHFPLTQTSKQIPSFFLSQNHILCLDVTITGRSFSWMESKKKELTC